jgi:circadian clock protein KaiC
MTRERRRGQPERNSEGAERIASGNAQVDEILGGGFPAGSINVVMGPPGTGKTIFAQRLLFHNAGPDRSCLYVTTISEPLIKVMAHLRGFAFFNPDHLSSAIQYVDMGPQLFEIGPNALIDGLSHLIRTQSPKIVVIDSFRPIHDLSQGQEAFRRFISHLATLLSAHDVTAFLLGEYTAEDIRTYPEFAVADAIVEFGRETLTTRDERYFRVLKLRGSGYREGRHAFRITNAGLEVYPRLVTPRAPEQYDWPTERVVSGVPGLDDLIGGGFLTGSTTLLVGMTGAGKTTMALQFVLEGVRRAEEVMFINFQENPAQLRRAISALGKDGETFSPQKLNLLYVSPVELHIDSIVDEVFGAIKAKNIRRLVIDSVGDLSAAASDAHRLHDYLYSLIQHFAVRGVTTVLTMESGEGFTAATSVADQRFSYMADALIHLAWDSEKMGRRMMRIVKMRNTAHESRSREYEIGAHGVRVL